ncbi:MAG TPA: NAD(P)/FAD-dependent oxidoreductase [Stenomitos sp.]
MKRVVIVGAGLAGLACANELREHGLDVVVLERAPRVGGRIGSRYTEGFILDAGFQVFLPAYPSARRLLDYHALDLRPIASGALVWDGARLQDFTLDPRRPVDLLRALAVPWFTWRDRWLLTKLTLDVGSLYDERVLGRGPSMPTRDYWRSYGFSEAFIRMFLAPFFSGVFFDPELETDSRLFRFYWKMMALAGAAVPAQGMQAVPEQLAQRLGGSIRLQSSIEGLVRRGASVSGVRLDSGETVEADFIVLATDLPEVSRLSGIQFALEGRPVTNLAFAHRRPWTREPKLLLNASPDHLVNQMLPASIVSPSYAPPDEHLSILQVVGSSSLDDATLADRCLQELKACFPREPFDDWRLLRVDRVAFGQFRERPEDLAHRPGPRLGPQLYLASEALFQSSIEGALHGGLEAANSLVTDLNRALVQQSADQLLT